MAENKLSDRKIKTLKPIEKEQNVGDGGGLWLRIQPSTKGGAKTWYYRYTHGGKPKRFTIGQYPGITLADARKKRNDAREVLAYGRDPAKFSGASKDAYSVRELAELWQDTILSNHADGGDKIIRALEHDLLPSLGDQAVTTVTYDQIIDLIEIIVERGAKTQASKVLSFARQMFAFGVRRRLLQADPAAGIRGKDVGAAEKSRDRHLTWKELKQLAQQIDHAGLHERIKAALWIHLATGVRPIELRIARLEHLDLEKREWVLPQTKNRSEHLIHLSYFAVGWFKVLIEYEEDGWLLSGTKCGKPASDGFLRKLLGERIGTVTRTKPTEFRRTLELHGGPWRLQDLRRTMATRMGDLGVSPQVIDACLNHKPRGVTGVYQRQTYIKERAQAFDLWGQELSSL